MDAYREKKGQKLSAKQVEFAVRKYRSGHLNSPILDRAGSRKIIQVVAGQRNFKTRRQNEDLVEPDIFASRFLKVESF